MKAVTLITLGIGFLFCSYVLYVESMRHGRATVTTPNISVHHVYLGSSENNRVWDDDVVDATHMQVHSSREAALQNIESTEFPSEVKSVDQNTQHVIHQKVEACTSMYCLLRKQLSVSMNDLYSSMQPIDDLTLQTQYPSMTKYTHYLEQSMQRKQNGQNEYQTDFYLHSFLHHISLESSYANKSSELNDDATGPFIPSYLHGNTQNKDISENMNAEKATKEIPSAYTYSDRSSVYTVLNTKPFTEEGLQRNRCKYYLGNYNNHIAETVVLIISADTPVEDIAVVVHYIRTTCSGQKMSNAHILIVIPSTLHFITYTLAPLIHPYKSVELVIVNEYKGNLIYSVNEVQVQRNRKVLQVQKKENSNKIVSNRIFIIHSAMIPQIKEQVGELPTLQVVHALFMGLYQQSQAERRMQESVCIFSQKKQLEDLGLGSKTVSTLDIVVKNPELQNVQAIIQELRDRDIPSSSNLKYAMDKSKLRSLLGVMQDITDPVYECSIFMVHQKNIRLDNLKPLKQSHFPHTLVPALSKDVYKYIHKKYPKDIIIVPVTNPSKDNILQILVFNTTQFGNRFTTMQSHIHSPAGKLWAKGTGYSSSVIFPINRKMVFLSQSKFVNRVQHVIENPIDDVYVDEQYDSFQNIMKYMQIYQNTSQLYFPYEQTIDNVNIPIYTDEKDRTCVMSTNFEKYTRPLRQQIPITVQDSLILKGSTDSLGHAQIGGYMELFHPRSTDKCRQYVYPSELKQNRRNIHTTQLALSKLHAPWSYSNQISSEMCSNAQLRTYISVLCDDSKKHEFQKPPAISQEYFHVSFLLPTKSGPSDKHISDNYLFTKQPLRFPVLSSTCPSRWENLEESVTLHREMNQLKKIKTYIPSTKQALTRIYMLIESLKDTFDVLRKDYIQKWNCYLVWMIPTLCSCVEIPYLRLKAQFGLYLAISPISTSFHAHAYLQNQPNLVLNELSIHAYDSLPSQLYIPLQDDLVILTKDWLSPMISTLHPLYHKLTQIQTNSNKHTYHAYTRTHIEVFNGYVHPYYPHVLAVELITSIYANMKPLYHTITMNISNMINHRFQNNAQNTKTVPLTTLTHIEEQRLKNYANIYLRNIQM